MKHIFNCIISLALIQTLSVTLTHAQIVTNELESELLVNPAYPSLFEGMTSNVITDDRCCLDAFYENLYQSRFNNSGEPIKVVHIGDGHVEDQVISKQVADNLKKHFPNLQYIAFGKNGATYLSFINSGLLEKVYEYKPDLIIVSFGTNEGLSSTYSGEKHYSQIHELITTLREELPDALFLLTTPTGSYLTNGKLNPKNAEVAQTIARYADENNMATYNLYEVLGGADYACQNLKAAKHFRVDGVHFTWDAYRMQGIMLYNALMNGFLDYIETIKK